MQDKTTSEMRNLKSKKLYLQVYDELCNYIQENNLDPGDKLPTEAEMTAMLGVSRNVLREAIKALEITGVITSKPGVGITICKTRSDLMLSSLLSQINAMSDDRAKSNIEELRCVLEISFCKRAFDTITPEQLSIMEKQVDIMQSKAKNIQKNDEISVDSGFTQADALFHSTLYSGANNILLSAILSLFWSSDTYFKKKMFHDSMEDTVLSHKCILNALKDRNFDEFYNSMLRHFSNYRGIVDNTK
ncbi:MAG: FadR family transcriptional regulator [Ruminococcaceae bacterium]|nr:FadR family transcriptional regulator [Oscillospiraceae bacterium]